jgi:hypothetical protein
MSVSVEVTIERPPDEVFAHLNGSFTVEPANGGSRMRVELDPRPGGPPARAMPLLRPSMRSGALQDLARLKALLEP